jgi:hypothetical protein
MCNSVQFAAIYEGRFQIQFLSYNVEFFSFQVPAPQSQEAVEQIALPPGLLATFPDVPNPNLNFVFTHIHSNPLKSVHIWGQLTPIDSDFHKSI